jgi:hypothetical protein
VAFLVAGGGESLGEEPDREDQLEEAAWDNRQHAGALGHVDHIEHVQDGSHEQHRIGNDAQDFQPAWDQPCLIQQVGEDPSGHADDQIDHHDGDVVFCLQQRAQLLGSGCIKGAVAHSVTERDHQEGRRQCEEARDKFADSETDVSKRERLTVAFLDACIQDHTTPAASAQTARQLLDAYLAVLLAHREVVPLVATDVAVLNHPSIGPRLRTQYQQLRTLLAAPDTSPLARLRAEAALGAIWRPLITDPPVDLTDPAHQHTLVDAAVAALQPSRPSPDGELVPAAQSTRTTSTHT